MPRYTSVLCTSKRAARFGLRSPRIDDADPLAPQREAALFYGLFLRGHSANTLRRDIDVPKKLLEKLLKRHPHELRVRENLQRSYQYRKQVLAISTNW